MGAMTTPKSSLSTSEDLSDAVIAPVAAKAGGEKVRVLLIGDSTVSEYVADSDTRGWGQMLPEFFTDEVAFLNAAAGGRSTKSFRDEGRWEKGLEFRPHFVFVQFGHNDQTGKGEYRETDPATTYPENLRRYVAEAREIGAQTILITSIARRTFEEGRVVSTLGPWVEAAQAVGVSEGVPVIDLHGKSIRLYEELGEEGSAYVNNGRPTDRTHFSAKGAHQMAQFIVEDLRAQVPELARFLKAQP